MRYTQADKEAEFFYNEPLNRLLLQVYRLFFSQDRHPILDHDHTKLYTTKPDALACNKGLGYYASCFITDQIPLYVSMQSGNTTPKTNLAEVLKAGFEAMEKAGLFMSTFGQSACRATRYGACYSEEAIKSILHYCQHYFIRSRKSQVRQDLIKPEECSLVDIHGELYRIYKHTDTFTGRSC